MNFVRVQVRRQTRLPAVSPQHVLIEHWRSVTLWRSHTDAKDTARRRGKDVGCMTDLLSWQQAWMAICSVYAETALGWGKRIGVKPVSQRMWFLNYKIYLFLWNRMKIVLLPCWNTKFSFATSQTAWIVLEIWDLKHVEKSKEMLSDPISSRFGCRTSLTVVTEDFTLSGNFISPSYLQRASKCLLDHQLAAETHFPAKKVTLVVRVWASLSLPPSLFILLPISFQLSAAPWLKVGFVQMCVCTYPDLQTHHPGCTTPPFLRCLTSGYLDAEDGSGASALFFLKFKICPVCGGYWTPMATRGRGLL